MKEAIFTQGVENERGVFTRFVILNTPLDQIVE